MLEQKDGTDHMNKSLAEAWRSLRSLARLGATTLLSLYDIDSQTSNTTPEYMEEILSLMFEAWSDDAPSLAMYRHCIC